MALKKRFLLLRTKLPIIRQTLVMGPGDKIEQVLFQIRAGAGDRVNFVLTNHLGEGDAELGGAQRAGQSDHHFPAAVDMGDVSVGGVFYYGGVEVAVMTI